LKILVINGPNLNLLKQRDPELYGSLSLESIQKYLSEEFPKNNFEFFQSNSEGEIINHIQNASSNFDALIINPGGYAHTSVSIRDALELCKIPKIEVHLSNVAGREDFRKNLITASVCDGYLSGFKEHSYYAAVKLIEKILQIKS
jgi:3-dehydroquinate dehydratase II